MTATCALPKTINAGETYACEVMRTAQSAPEGKAFVAKASVGCLTNRASAGLV